MEIQRSGYSKMIAITGASGFIGNYIADRLDFPQKRLSRQEKHNDSKKRLHKWIKGDFEKTEELDDFIKDSPTLVHLAWSSYPRNPKLDIQHEIQRNLIPTIRLLEAFAKINPGGHIIFSSTGGNMYDPTPNGIPRTEEHSPCPQSSYGIQKLAAENYLRLFCQIYSLRATILRISNPYGVLLPKQRTQGLIGVAFAKLLANEPLQIFDHLESVRDYIHLDDVTRAFALSIQHPPKVKECRVLNVCSGVGHPISEVLHLVERTTGRSIIKQFSDVSFSLPTWSVLSYQKIKQTLGWIPTINLQEGIKRMAAETPIFKTPT